MPLIHSKSKKAFSKNVATEMKHGKPQDQSLAIAYSIKRKAKKHMAEGGDPSISAKTEKRPMPNEMHSDSDQERRNSGKKASKNDMWTDMPTVAQAQRPSKTPLSQPRMVESSVIRSKLRDHEGNLMEKDAPESDKAQPEEFRNEKGPDRQGPKSRDIGMKMMARGGEIEDDPDHQAKRHNKSINSEYGGAAEEDREEEPAGLESDDDQERVPVDEYMAGHFAEGGRAGGEEDSYDDNGHEDSIAAAIMARRDRLHDEIDSGAHDEDLAASYADGGEVDLSINADEEPNNEDQMSFEALKKENYSESEGLDALDQPEDSNEKGDEEEKDSENKNDRISAIRSRMSKRKQR